MEIQKEPEPIQQESPVEEEIIAEQAPEAQEDVEAASREEKQAVEEEPLTVPEDDLFEAPTTRASNTDTIVEIETIESAIPSEHISRADLNRKFTAIVKDLKTDLDDRSQKLKEKKDQQAKEQISETRSQNITTILADNQALFKAKRIEAKWKHFPMSRSMRLKYMPKVDKVIKAIWKLPYEMDPNLEARVELVVLKSGSILEYAIVESSEDRYFNHAVIQVLKDLDQLPPLPEDFSGESTKIGLRFTSN